MDSIGMNTHTCHKGGRMLLAVFMFMGMAGSICDIGARVLAHYSWDEAVMKENIKDTNPVNPENPESYLYRRFHGKKPVSPVLYSEPGEAAKGPLRFMHTGETRNLSKP